MKTLRPDIFVVVDPEKPAELDWPVMRVERRAAGVWAITRDGLTLNRNGQYEYEPQPSSRSAAYLARCRFTWAEVRDLLRWRDVDVDGLVDEP